MIFSVRWQRLLQASFCVLFMTLFVACSGKKQPVPVLDIVPPPVADLDIFPQDLTVYASRAGLNRILLNKADQAVKNARFDSFFFNPWDMTKHEVKASEAFLIFGLKSKSKPRGWAENLLPWTEKNWTKLVANANRFTYPSRFDKAITVAKAPLREAPTDSPRYGNPLKPGQGYPFDMFMYAMLPPGMPLVVTHTSRDGAWFFVENALVSGWVSARYVAIADEAFCRTYRKGQYAAIIQENVALTDPSSGQKLSTADIGAIFPIDRRNADGLTILVPVRTQLGYAAMKAVNLTSSEVAEKPLPLTPEAVARLGNKMMGQPYGWGGLHGNRDCSSMLRDLFTPFGIWLPRNSSAQAKSWSYVPFGTDNVQHKEAKIFSQGKPFATLLWMKGHITLYIGKYDNRAVIFHDMWGVKTEDAEGNEGRKVVGKVVVTSTQPGIELPSVKKDQTLIHRMRGMSILR